MHVGIYHGPLIILLCHIEDELISIILKLYSYTRQSQKGVYIGDQGTSRVELRNGFSHILWT